jgi:AcrR family transcriptional regulator
MSDGRRPENERKPNPLGTRVDALLRRNRDPAAKASDVPVLTEVVDDEARRRPAVDPAALEALARELERAVLERLGPEVERVIEEKLARVLSGLVGQSVDGMRSELTQSVTQMVREAVAASVARALAPSSAPSEKK